ncbi:hypothetical protein MLD38_018924 [Melastoma candidum]|uniref:Uncharacterized protein n=1 Tax=Melastoma candidum TaxID=119954 RepID=A0ACB9QVD0_9MYRT|nr:hypothetical protein MLD38_018924 [Melastoma candidum]
MNIADRPTDVQLPRMYNKEENPKAPTIEDWIGVCTRIFKSDNIPNKAIVKLVAVFLGQSIDFCGALMSNVYDDEVRKWVSGVRVKGVGRGS